MEQPPQALSPLLTAAWALLYGRVTSLSPFHSQNDWGCPWIVISTTQDWDDVLKWCRKSDHPPKLNFRLIFHKYLWIIKQGHAEHSVLMSPAQAWLFPVTCLVFTPREGWNLNAEPGAKMHQLQTGTGVCALLGINTMGLVTCTRLTSC